MRAKLLHSPVCMVLIAFLARALYILVSHCYRLRPESWYVFEMANIGHWLAVGQGFTMRVDTGPSAWTAPLYPCIVALAFRLFGVFSHAAALALLNFNSAFAALTCWTIYRIAQRVFNETIAVWSGWIWAFLPTSIYYSAYWIWETTLSTFLLSLLFLLTLRMEDDSRLLPWCGYGLLWGVVALINTSVVSWLPFSGCWLAYQLHRRGRRYLLPVVVSALFFWATLTPWMVRNYLVFGSPLIRGDFGVELRAGNNPKAEGYWVGDYTANNPVLLRQYIRQGEAAFVSAQGKLAREWIAEHPGRFLAVSLHRFIYFWSGIPHQGMARAGNLLFFITSALSIAGLVLTLRQRVHGGFLFAALLAFYPLIYYITFPTPRYRHAIEPEMLILSVFLVFRVLSQTLTKRLVNAGAPVIVASACVRDTPDG